MNETKEKTAELVNKAKAHVPREAGAPTCRAILIAGRIGVFIGLVLRR